MAESPNCALDAQNFSSLKASVKNLISVAREKESDFLRRELQNSQEIFFFSFSVARFESTDTLRHFFFL